MTTSQPPTPERVVAGPLELDGDTLTVHDLAAHTKSGRIVPDAPGRRTHRLPASQAMLLRLLMQRPGTTVPGATLLGAPPGRPMAHNTLVWCVSRIRDLLPECHDAYVRIVADGQGGYRLVVDVPAERIRFTTLAVHPAAHCCWLDGRRIELEPRSAPVLVELVCNGGKLVSRDALRAVGRDEPLSLDALRSAVGTLRRRVTDKSNGMLDIRRSHGGGFALDARRVELGALQLDRATSVASLAGRPIAISVADVPLLAFLMHHGAAQPVSLSTLDGQNLGSRATIEWRLAELNDALTEAGTGTAYVTRPDANSCRLIVRRTKAS